MVPDVEFGGVFLGLMVPLRNATLLSSTHHAILTGMVDGSLTAIEDIWLSQKCVVKTDEDLALGAQNMKGLFIILAILVGLALALILIKFALHHYYQGRKINGHEANGDATVTTKIGLELDNVKQCNDAKPQVEPLDEIKAQLAVLMEKATQQEETLTAVQHQTSTVSVRLQSVELVLTRDEPRSKPSNGSALEWNCVAGAL